MKILKLINLIFYILKRCPNVKFIKRTKTPFVVKPYFVLKLLIMCIKIRNVSCRVKNCQSVSEKMFPKQFNYIKKLFFIGHSFLGAFFHHDKFTFGRDGSENEKKRVK